ncbi:hypothetical protein [Actinoplanes sp. NPDC026619]|uniref:hypothetical protein n=1 Tax=Actinoplanes sp. NPDC026619 TaxID=3155798 RepID=UPI00340C2845
MRINDVLESRLASLRQAARRQLVAEFEEIGLQVDGGGRVAEDPGVFRGGQHVPQIDIDLAQRIWNDTMRGVDDLCSRFESFYSLDPVALFVMGGPLDMRTIGTSPGASADQERSPSLVTGRITYADEVPMHQVTGLVVGREWEGGAAQAFRDGYVDPLKNGVPLQRGCLYELSFAVSSWHEGTLKAIEDLGKIADVATARFAGEFPPDPAPDGRAAVYGVAGVLATVAGFYGPVSLAANIVGLGLIAATDLDTHPADRTPATDQIAVEGFRVADIVTSTGSAISTLQQLCGREDAALAKKLFEDVSLGEGFDSPKIKPGQRPDLAAEPSLGPHSGGAVAADVGAIYDAGRVHLPSAASEYRNASAMLGECDPPPWLSLLFPKSPVWFDHARDMLGKAFASIAETLDECGANLVTVANGYAAVDSASAAAIAQVPTDSPRPASHAPTASRPTRGPF